MLGPVLPDPIVEQAQDGIADEMREIVQPTFTKTAQRLGVRSARAIVGVTAIYAVVLAIGLVRLPSPDVPIRGPTFMILEILILLLSPALVAVAVALHAWAAPQVRVYGQLAVVFMSMLAAVSSSVHVVVLTVGHQAAVAALPGASVLFSFTWPSVAYALDILAWDVFYPLGAASAALALGRDASARPIRRLLLLSAVLAVAGLSGVVANDMRWRNIGIIGYTVVFPVAIYRLGQLFARSAITPA